MLFLNIWHFGNLTKTEINQEIQQYQLQHTSRKVRRKKQSWKNGTREFAKRKKNENRQNFKMRIRIRLIGKSCIKRNSRLAHIFRTVLSFYTFIREHWTILVHSISFYIWNTCAYAKHMLIKFSNMNRSQQKKKTYKQTTKQTCITHYGFFRFRYFIMLNVKFLLLFCLVWFERYMMHSIFMYTKNHEYYRSNRSIASISSSLNWYRSFVRSFHFL